MTPYHGGGVPADRVKLISTVVLEMSLTNKNQGAPGQAVQTRVAQPLLAGSATILYGGAPGKLI